MQAVYWRGYFYRNNIGVALSSFALFMKYDNGPRRSNIFNTISIINDGVLYFNIFETALFYGGTLFTDYYIVFDKKSKYFLTISFVMANVIYNTVAMTEDGRISFAENKFGRKPFAIERPTKSEWKNMLWNIAGFAGSFIMINYPTYRS